MKFGIFFLVLMWVAKVRRLSRWMTKYLTELTMRIVLLLEDWILGAKVMCDNLFSFIFILHWSNLSDHLYTSFVILKIINDNTDRIGSK